MIRNQSSGLGGTTSAAAAAAGIPAIVAEAGGCGLLTEEDVEHHLRGLRGALTAVGMLDDAPVVAPDEQFLVDTFTWQRCVHAGWWQAEVRVGDDVSHGQRIGAVLDPFGEESEVVSAPHDGVVLFLTRSPAVADDGLLLGLGGDLTRLES